MDISSDEVDDDAENAREACNVETEEINTLPEIQCKSWLEQIDDEEKAASQNCFEETQEKFQPPVSSTKNVPLLDYLMQQYCCSMTELQIHFTNVIHRQHMRTMLRSLEIRTVHMKPKERNFRVRCDDFSAQNANYVQAHGGYLGITVRQYYFSKHRLRLRHSYMPCLIEHGGRDHQSYFPLEILCVVNKN